MRLWIRVGADAAVGEVEIEVDGDPSGRDLVAALVNSGHLQDGLRGNYRIGRTGRFVDVDDPVSVLGLRNGDLITASPPPGPDGTPTTAAHELVVASGPSAGSRYALAQGRTVVGRGDDVDVNIDDPALSRRHLAIDLEGDDATVTDLESRNGTFVLGRAAAGTTLPAGVPVEAGISAFRVEAVVPRPPTRSVIRDGREAFNRIPRVVPTSLTTVHPRRRRAKRVLVRRGRLGGMELKHVSLANSFVLNIESDESYVAFELDAALEPAHERFYWPPRPGENGAYAHLRWCLRGEVWWKEGPHLDRPAVGADGELDFGGIDAWFSEGDVDHLEGEWGAVAVRGAVQTVEYLSP